MGTAVCQAVAGAPDLELVAETGRGDDLGAALAASRSDVLVEFTVPDAVAAHVETALEAGVPVVSGTTGLGPAALDRIDAIANERGLGVVIAPNFAIGVILMQRFAAEAARHFDDVEIIELHHERKLDAPSGTARDTARRIARAADRPLNQGRPDERVDVPGARGGVDEGVPIHSVRLPGLVAHQEVLFGGAGQVLTIRHDALDRRAFMPGVLLAVRRVVERRGLVRSLHELLDDDGGA